MPGRCLTTLSAQIDTGKGAELMASLGPGTVQAVCAGIGRPEAAVQLLAAVGDVESAESSLIVWDLSRLVRGSSTLSAEFDKGVVGILDRLFVLLLACHVVSRQSARRLVGGMGGVGKGAGIIDTRHRYSAHSPL